MGTTAFNRDTRESVHETLMRQLCFKDPSHPNAFRVLDHALVNRTDYYAAAEHLNGPHAGKVFAIICVVSYARSDGMNFGYRAMTETEGPNENTCPARILDRLSPLDELYEPGTYTHQWASNWRNRCRDYLSKRAAAKQVKPGDIVQFDTPFSFHNGELQLSRFRYVKGSIFTVEGYHSRFRLTNWRNNPFSVVSASA